MTTAAAAGELREIPLEQLHESPLNPRRIFDPAKLEELRLSIQEAGVLTPLTVRAHPDLGLPGAFEIGAGHRRFRAAKLAGLTTVPAVVRTFEDRAFIELLCIDNGQRDDLHPLEEAESFATLMKEAGYDVARIAERTGRSPRYVYDSLTLLKLMPEAKQLFLAREFERGHAIELARLPMEWQRKALERDFNRYQNGAGGLWQHEHVEDDPLAPAQERLKLEDKVKPVSVRELKAWVNDHVRAHEGTIDPVLFPDTVRLIGEAVQEKRKVVHITYDYRVPDAARDPKIRTYGEASWKRADGKHGSKACEHAVVGLVVAGPGRGDAFPVCVAKEKCPVHWREYQKERARRAKEPVQRRRAGGAEKPRAVPFDETEAGKKAIAAVLKEMAPAIAHKVEAVLAKEVRQFPDALAWNLYHWIHEGGDMRWAKPGEEPDWQNGDELEDLQDVVLALLPGKWKKASWRGFHPADLAGARSGIAWIIYRARDFEAKAFKADVERIAKAKIAAAAPAPAKKPR